MKRLFQRRTFAIALCGLAATSLAADAFKDLVKIIGVGAAVTATAPKFNDAINRLASQHDTGAISTKVVPILTGGANSRKAIGGAQVMGPRDQVEKVKAVVQIEQDIFGKEAKIRAMIPVESKDAVGNVKRVEGVGVSGIVDVKL